MRFRSMIVLFSLMIFLFFFSLHSVAMTSLTWTAGPIGGGWYMMAGGMAELITEHLPDVHVRVIPGGGVENTSKVDIWDMDMGWGLTPLLVAGMRGEEPYTTPHEDVRGVAGGLGINHFHFYVGADTDFESVEEIFTSGDPIRIAVSVVGSSDEWVFRKVMEYYDTSYEKMMAEGTRFFHSTYGEQTSLFRDRDVDLVWCLLGLPGAAVTEASIGRRLRILNLPQDLVEHLQNEFFLPPGEIPAGTYSEIANKDENVYTSTIPNVIIANKNVDEEAIYRITKVINENIQDVHNIHTSFRVFSPEVATSGLGVPLHPGAEKYYQEQGLLD